MVEWKFGNLSEGYEYFHDSWGVSKGSVFLVGILAKV